MPKNMNFAILEAVQAEMRRNKLLTLLYEYQRPSARYEQRGIDLVIEFGPPRVRFCAIDEQWIVGATLGMSMMGVPAIAHIPSMTTFIPFELMFNHAGKLRHMTGGQAAFPMVLWADMAGRNALQGGQHADAGLESAYARLTGLKVVIPSNPYDAKGLMTAAIRDPDPVVYCHYSCPASGPDVPDEAYTVPIGQAVVRTVLSGTHGWTAVEGIPARVCPACGERYYDEATTWQLVSLTSSAPPADPAPRQIPCRILSYVPHSQET